MYVKALKTMYSLVREAEFVTPNKERMFFKTVLR